MRDKTLWLLLGLGLVRGLIYLSVVPPWQHYDEPAHFERLYWLVESQFRYAISPASLSLPAEISSSICQYHFWGNVPCDPTPLSYTEPPSLQALGVFPYPLYYYLSALFLLPFRYVPVEIYLYLGRLVSVFLYMATLVIAYFLVRDLFPTDNQIRVVVPAFIALLPAFTDLSSALNNDAGAIAVLSFLLWGIVRLIRYGWSLPSLAWVIGMALIAAFTKRTTVIGLLFAIIGILMRCRWLGKWVWAIGGALLVATIFVVFEWSGCASWYELGSFGKEAVRESSEGPVGKHVLCVEEGESLVQELPPVQVEALQKKVVTFGAWLRADSSGVSAPIFALYDGTTFYTRTVTTSAGWQFYTLSIAIRPHTRVLQVRLLPLPGLAMTCYDGAVLAQGFLEEPPYFTDTFGEKGIWQGKPFVNLLSNGSGERPWPRLRPWISNLVSESGILPRSVPTLFIQSLLDWQRTGWIYKFVWNNLVQSFWARFGWNHVVLPEWCYRVLMIITLLGIGGAIIFCVRHLILGRQYQSWQRKGLALLMAAIPMVWGSAAIAYTHPLLATSPPIHIAAARYGYPYIIPTTLFLYLGWRELIPGRWRPFLPIFVLTGVAWLDVFSLLGTIIPFYYTNTGG